MDGGLNKRMGLGYAAYRNRRRRKTCQDQGVKRMDTRNIRFLESQGHNIIVHTPEGEYRFRQTMKEKNTVSVGGEQLQISRSRRKGLMEALTNYLGGK